MDPNWLRWGKELQALAQTGLAYPKDPFDVERYEAVLRLAAEMMAAGSGGEPEEILGLFAREAGHATPKVDVRAAVFRDGSILRVCERVDGFWTLPGGWADINESPGEAVVREVREEAGCEVRPARLLALYDRNKHEHPYFPFHAYKVFFECELLREGEPTQTIEVLESAFFSEQRLPPLSTARVTGAQIHRLFELHRQPELPADFD